MDGMKQLIDSLKDIETLQAMPMGEKLLAGLAVAFIGITITFLGLMLLWGAIALMSKLLYKPVANPVKVINQTKPQDMAVAKVEGASPAAIAGEAQEDELIAVITAAVAASLKTSIHNIVVRNIVRIPDETPAWARSGRVDQINGRF